MVRCRSVEAFTQIGASPLLRHLSVHLVCGYLVSSLLYFARSRIFAAALSGSATRMRWFSAVHALSGSLILALQLLATGAPAPTNGHSTQHSTQHITQHNAHSTLYTRRREPGQAGGCAWARCRSSVRVWLPVLGRPAAF